MSDDRRAIDTVGEYVGLGVIVGFLLLVTAVGSGVYALQNPSIDEKVRYSVGGSPDYSNDTLVFTRSQVESMNKAYEDRREEYGWCLDIRDGRVIDLSHPQTSDDPERDSIAFSCYNYFDGRAHNHPSYLAVPELSEVDKKTLIRSQRLVSCVMSDPVPSRIGENPSSLKCYKNPALNTVSSSQLDPYYEYEYEQVSVEIVNDD